jgi:hypothetical protein
MNPNSQNRSGTPTTERKGKPESPQSKETFEHRTERPGEAGLANERRPGLGSRGRGEQKPAPTKFVAQDSEPLGRNAPLPPRQPREQKPDARAAEQERDTGASGQMGLK